MDYKINLKNKIKKRKVDDKDELLGRGNDESKSLQSMMIS